MSKRKSSITINDLTPRHQAILASFVFVPTPPKLRGRQARDLVKTCEIVFRELFNSGRYNRAWVSVVSNNCRTLVRLGLLEIVSTVKRSWFHGDEEFQYDSPIYGLTESGYNYVLANMDHRYLCSQAHAFKHYSKRSHDILTLSSFKRYIGMPIKHEEVPYDSDVF